MADHDDRGIEGELPGPVPELTEWDVVRAGERPLGDLVGLTDVEDEDRFPCVQTGSEVLGSDVGGHGRSGSSKRIGRPVRRLPPCIPVVPTIEGVDKVPWYA